MTSDKHIQPKPVSDHVALVECLGKSYKQKCIDVLVGGLEHVIFPYIRENHPN